MNELLQSLGEHEGAWSYLVMGACAIIEYLFPPFPGDTVTLFGAFLITAEGWNPIWVTTSVTVGSVIGAAADYWIGLWLAKGTGREPRTWFGRYWHRARDRIDPMVDKLRHRSPAYLVVNRFLPGIRAFFFVAAGMAGMRRRAVLFYAAVSALAWNLVIIGAGAGLGASWERLRSLAETYTTVVWIILSVIGLVVLVRWGFQVYRAGSRAKKSEAKGEPAGEDKDERRVRSRRLPTGRPGS